jgi:hypothetical protein
MQQRYPRILALGKGQTGVHTDFTHSSLRAKRDTIRNIEINRGRRETDEQICRASKGMAIK